MKRKCRFVEFFVTGLYRKWSKKKSKNISSNHYISVSVYNWKGIYIKLWLLCETGNFTQIVSEFELTRRVGWYILELYIPCGLIVILSWVSFWLSTSAVAARVTLGVSTVLAITTQSSGEIRGKLYYVLSQVTWAKPQPMRGDVTYVTSCFIRICKIPSIQSAPNMYIIL